MWLPTLTSLLVASVLADVTPAFPDTTDRNPILRPPAEVEFVTPDADALSSRMPWREFELWNGALVLPPGVLLRQPATAVGDSLYLTLLLARCGRAENPASAWSLDPALGLRMRLLRLEASWLPMPVRRLLLAQARAAAHHRLKAREAELYGEFLGMEVPITEVPAAQAPAAQAPATEIPASGH